MRTLARFAAVIVMVAQCLVGQGGEESKPGSIRGSVTNAATGLPVADLPVQIAGQRIEGTTDAEGRFEFQDLLPRRYSLIIGAPYPSVPIYSRLVVNIHPGEDVGPIDLVLQPTESISGVVSDEDGEPMPGLEVVLLGREHAVAGGLRSYRRAASRTDDRGTYRLVRNVAAGSAWLVWVRRRDHAIDPISDVPDDPELRRPATIPTYYPNADTPETASLLTLGVGEQREGVDIRMLRSKSFCIEARVDLPGGSDEVSYWYQRTTPSFGIGLRGGTTGLPSGGEVGPERKLRICDLSPGEYRLTAYSGNLNHPELLGETLVSITDRDVRGVTIVPQPRLPLKGRAVWGSKPPDEPVDAELRVLLTSLHRSYGGSLGARSAVPGTFEIQQRNHMTGEMLDPLMDDYRAMVRGLGDGLYVRDVLYGGASVLNGPLVLGSAIGDAELRVLLEHDGGVLAVKVTNADGEPAMMAHVVVMPKSAKTARDVAWTRVAGATDQRGDYSTPPLEPGTYYAMAFRTDVSDLSPEVTAMLLNARAHAEEVEIGPNATVNVTLELAKPN